MAFSSSWQKSPAKTLSSGRILSEKLCGTVCPSWSICGQLLGNVLNCYQCSTEVEGVSLDAPQLPGQFNGRTARFKESTRKTEAQWRDNDVP